MIRSAWPCACLLLVLGGCSLQQPDPGKAYYLLETPVVTRSTSPAGALETLRVAQARVTPPFDSRALQYRVAANQFEPNYYHNWADAPGALVTEAVLEAISLSGAYLVVDESSSATATRTLELYVTELAIDVTTPRPQAVLAVRATLLDADGNVLRNVELRRAEASASAEAPDVVARWNTELGDIVSELLREFSRG